MLAASSRCTGVIGLGMVEVNEAPSYAQGASPTSAPHDLPTQNCNLKRSQEMPIPQKTRQNKGKGHPRMGLVALQGVRQGGKKDWHQLLDFRCLIDRWITDLLNS